MVRRKNALSLSKRRIRSMKCKFILIPLYLLTFTSYAQLIRAPQTPQEEFDAYIETEKITSYAKSQLQQIQNQSNSIQSLSSLLEQAQRSFIKGHLQQSGDYFRAIVQKTHEKDWIEEAQNIIFYSYLRLAQIEWKENPDSFLHSAILFSPFSKPDTSLFPPPLIQRFNEIKNNQPSLLVYLKTIFPFHEMILINGEFFLKDHVRLPYGNYRVTALSSSHQPWSQKVSLSDLVQKRIVTPPWVSGTCKRPSHTQNIKKENILYPAFCRWKPSSKKHHDKKLIQKKTPNTVIQNNIEQTITMPLKNNKWLWTGIVVTGVVIGIIIFSQKDKKPNVKIPSIQKGFPQK